MTERSLDSFYLANKNTEQFSQSESGGVSEYLNFRGLPQYISLRFVTGLRSRVKQLKEQ